MGSIRRELGDSGDIRMHATVKCEHNSNEVCERSQGACSHQLYVAHFDLDRCQKKYARAVQSSGGSILPSMPNLHPRSRDAVCKGDAHDVQSGVGADAKPGHCTAATKIRRGRLGQRMRRTVRTAH